jgi:hypothetical protein
MHVDRARHRGKALGSGPAAALKDKKSPMDSDHAENIIKKIHPRKIYFKKTFS